MTEHNDLPDDGSFLDKDMGKTETPPQEAAEALKDLFKACPVDMTTIAMSDTLTLALHKGALGVMLSFMVVLKEAKLRPATARKVQAAALGAVLHFMAYSSKKRKAAGPSVESQVRDAVEEMIRLAKEENEDGDEKPEAVN